MIGGTGRQFQRNHRADVRRDLGKSGYRIAANLDPRLRQAVRRGPGAHRAHERNRTELVRDVGHQPLRKAQIAIAGGIEIRRRPGAFFQIERIGVAGRARQQNEDAVLAPCRSGSRPPSR